MPEPTATESASSDTTSAPGNPSPKCFDIPAGGTYSKDVGGLLLDVTIPADAAFDWQGYRDGFEMAQSCLFARPVIIRASIMEMVFGSCGHAFGRPADMAMAVKWLTESEDYTTSEPTQLTIGGHSATRFALSFESSPCAEPFELWPGAGVGQDPAGIVYLLDAESNGVPLGITIANRDAEGTPAQIAEAEALVASLRIEP